MSAWVSQSVHRDKTLSKAQPSTLSRKHHIYLYRYLIPPQVLIPRNSKIPCKFTKVFRTVIDNQPNLRVAIYEGEAPVAKDNQLLTEMRVTIPTNRRGPKGKEVELGLELDENGIFRLSCSEQERTAEEKAADER